MRVRISGHVTWGRDSLKTPSYPLDTYPALNPHHMGPKWMVYKWKILTVVPHKAVAEVSRIGIL
jgi:hypothetical protein